MQILLREIIDYQYDECNKQKNSFLASLPVDICLDIMSFTDPKTCALLSQTCKIMHERCNERVLPYHYVYLFSKNFFDYFNQFHFFNLSSHSSSSQSAKIKNQAIYRHCRNSLNECKAAIKIMRNKNKKMNNPEITSMIIKIIAEYKEVEKNSKVFDCLWIGSPIDPCQPEMNGPGQFIAIDKVTYIGMFVDNNLTGQSKIIEEDGTIIEGTCIEGEVQGRSFITYPDGSVEEKWI